MASNRYISGYEDWPYRRETRYPDLYPTPIFYPPALPLRTEPVRPITMPPTPVPAKGKPVTTTTNGMTAQTPGAFAAEMKSNLESAAWRSAAKGVLTALRKPVMAAIAARTGPPSSKFLALLQTKEGEAVVSVLVGLIPLGMPSITQNNRKLDRLFAEMRVLGMETLTDMVMDTLLSPILSILSTTASSLPD